MKEVTFVIESNEALTENVYRMRLRGDVEGIRAGQFVNIQLPGLFLRRPISVCEVAPFKTSGEVAPLNISGEEKDGRLTIIYKVVGKGTDLMAQMETGMELDVLTGLGNGYDLSLAGERPLLVGGGVGVPPMYELASQLLSQGGEQKLAGEDPKLACEGKKLAGEGQNLAGEGRRKVTVVLGFNTKSEVFYEEEFKKLGCDVVVTTVDGSYGEKGFVTDWLGKHDAQCAEEDRFTYFYACGPMPMLRALCAATTTDGEISMEERMGCGFGICVGCTTKTKSGQKRVCKEGPVFKKSEVIFDL